MFQGLKTECTACSSRGSQAFRHDFTMAFQPIFDINSGKVFAQEALVRPIGDGSAWDVIKHVTETNRYSFDQKCRTQAIAVASRLGIDTRLSINFMPNAVYNPEHCIQATLQAAERYAFPTDRLIFEFTEAEAVRDTGHLVGIVESYRARGFMTAIDDFGAGYAGLGLLCDLHPDIVKIDMALVRGIAGDPRRRKIVGAIHDLCVDLGIAVMAEGIEEAADADALRELGIKLVQGFYFARPAYERLILSPEAGFSAKA
ncbi:EAL domain-containing protein [Palleronia sp.]|uniref:EAL domain-containing protein n=1 Tax=Palleronia sp. TaxID=1940284 RepID=UPI0035C85C4C